MGLKLANNAISQLASSITAVATSVPLKTGDGAKFPVLTAGDYHPATISKSDGSFEIVKVTARSGDTLTVTRAQEGTTALAFDANSQIELRLTNGALLNAEGLTASATNSATSKATPADADELPLVDSAASNGLKKLTWANLKSAIASYLASLSQTLTNKTINGSNNTITNVSLSTGVTGTLPVANGGTEATTAAGARSNIGAQETLVSGTNIKTVGGVSLLGSGNIVAGLAAASSAEAQAGTSDSVAITPLQLRNGLNASGSAPVYAARAWVNFNGTGTVAIRASGNVSSVTDNGTGDYTVNFSTAMPDTNYVLSGIGQNIQYCEFITAEQSVAPSVSFIRIRTQNTNAYGDCPYVRIVILR